MLKSLLRRKPVSFSFSCFRNINTCKNNASKREKKKTRDGEEQPNSYGDASRCPVSWVERVGLFTTVLAVSLNWKVHFYSQSEKNERRRAHEEHERRRCPLLRSIVLLASPSLKLNVLPEKQSNTANVSKPAERGNDVNYNNNSSTVNQLMQQLHSDSVVYANEFNNLLAMAYLENNEPQIAIKLLRKCINNAKANFNLGLIYEMGKHDNFNRVPDYQSAVDHYETAAAMGHKYAAYNLALIYLYGKGTIEANEEKANKLLIKAAELGVEEAKQYVESNQLINTAKTTKGVPEVRRNLKMSSSSSEPNLHSFLNRCERRIPKASLELLKTSENTCEEASNKPFVNANIHSNFASELSLKTCFVN